MLKRPTQAEWNTRECSWNELAEFGKWYTESWNADATVEEVLTVFYTLWVNHTELMKNEK